MPRRGPSDRLSEQQCHALEADLRPYILQMQESSTPLWCFAVYGNTLEDGCRFTEKSPLVIGDLLRNAPLWALLLKFMPCQNDRQLLGWHHAEELLLDEADGHVQVDGCHVHCLVE